MSAVLDLPTIQQATREGRIFVARCAECGHEQALPSPTCLRCGCQTLAIRAQAGDGTLYSWSLAGIAFESEVEGDVPYLVAVILLSGGAKLWCRLGGMAADSPLLRPDQPMQIDAALTRERGYLVFRPATKAT
jgi:uncharacterized OB-fold protein